MSAVEEDPVKQASTKQVDSFSGQALREMFAAATVRLERNATEINALNVFPVPDGDTGTNMLLTMRATLEEASRSPDHSASAISRAMARGALMGARGNSGVILSQIFKGLANGLEDKAVFNGSDLAAALAGASSLAYKGVSQPVEGTILTVIREVSTAAQAAAAEAKGVESVVEAAATAARTAVARTPSLLAVLRDAGVVDAGGQGLSVMLDGIVGYLRGETEEIELKEAATPVGVWPTKSSAQMTLESKEQAYGYCTEFLLAGEKLDPEKIRERLATLGESLLVVGDEETIRVHIHTFDPGTALSYATSLGVLHQIKVQNMDDQHEDFLELKKVGTPAAEIAIVAVVSGDGLAQVFRSLGAATIVPGGQTMNPSVQQLLEAVETTPSEEVILLPNNHNIVLTATQAQALATKRVEVVPTETIPQGVAALLAFNHEQELGKNVAAMKESISTVRTGEVTIAIRSTKYGDLTVEEGQAIGLLDGELAMAGGSPEELLHEMLSKLNLAEGGIITIYNGADVDQARAESLAESIRQKYPDQEIELVAGGQPHYRYIFSVE